MELTKVLKENETRRITEDRFLGRFLEGKNKFGRWVIIGSFRGLGFSKYESAEKIWSELVLT